MERQDGIFWRIGHVFAKRAPAQERHSGSGAVRWRLLELLNIYRILVAAATIILAAMPPIASALDIDAPQAVLVIGIIYLALGLLAIPTLAREWPNLRFQSQLEPILDLLAAAIIIQTTGAHLGILAAMLVPPATVSAATVKTHTQAAFFAALAALTVIAAAFGDQISGTEPVAIYTQAGLFGLGILAIALVVYTLSRRLSESEVLTLLQSQKLRQLNAINSHIIGQLHTGILVTDETGQIQRSNPAAETLLDAGARNKVLRLAANSKGRETHTLKLSGDAVRLLYIQPLGQDEHAERLIFVEDAKAVTEQAQALKLAALGRLTAGVAHQVRNPLSAITHANQLLSETDGLDERSKHLVKIIARQSARLDAVVEDILSLSRQASGKPRLVNLSEWLDVFIPDYGERQPDNKDRLTVKRESANVEVNFDLGHLDQIVSNLINNAFVHGDSPQGVELVIGTHHDETCLEVRDHGPGIQQPERLFEPFATTHAQGTGLGLYLARELAHANGAWLEAENRPQGGACFRLSFPKDSTWLK